MKKNVLILVLCIACFSACKRNITPETSIIAFLTDVKKPNWKFDDIYEKHIRFDNRAAVNPFFERMIENNLRLITDYLDKENVDPTKLKITRYDKADPKLQHMLIDDSWKTRVYIVQGKNFKRYIMLTNNNYIRTWMTQKRDRIFWVF